MPNEIAGGGIDRCSAGRGHQLAQLLVGGLLAGMDPLQVRYQLGGDALAGLADHVARPDAGEQLLGLGSRQVLLRSARDQFQQ
jgi:hypothetical protein